MKSAEIREKFLDFFAERNHTIVPSSSLLSADPTVLLTTAGMQQFKEYYLRKPSPYGNRVASCQKCFRTSDIDQVGDNFHLTFLEMLGNFSFAAPSVASGEGGAVSADLRRPKPTMAGEGRSLGRRRSIALATEREGGEGYFKKEAIELASELLNSKFKIQNSKLWITYFKGDPSAGSGQVIPEDIESRTIWQSLGIKKERIFGFGRADNFWGPTGIEGPCGPTTEIHFDLTGKPCELGKDCIPNCRCGRFVELWNLVFNEYYQNETGKLTPLGQKGVDTGMGLERLAMVIQGKTSVFETDLFLPIIVEIKKMMKIKEVIEPSSFERLFTPRVAFEKEKEKLFKEIENLKYEKGIRIITDHIKASVFLASEDIFPSNVEEGYVLRRILRRAIRFGKLITQPARALRAGFLIPLANKVIDIYGITYPEIKSNQADILTIIQNEEEKFEKTLEMGLKQFEKIIKNPQFQEKKIIPGERAFCLFETYGFPLELTEELAEERGFLADKEGFQIAFQKHQEISRAGAEKKFGGIGKKVTYQATKLHTATHLLHQALREILGSHVKQMGSDITSERLRFDFSHPKKLNKEEIKKVEDLVNQKIKENLKVKKEEMPYQKARESGALAFFKEKYPEIVAVYSIGDPSDPSGRAFSKEICGGPHVNQTSELGRFQIVKEESLAAGVRRIRAILKPEK